MPTGFELYVLVNNLAVMVNDERKALGLRELYVVPYLSECAEIRVKEAAEFFSHTRPNGEYCSSVIDYKKFEYGYFSENLVNAASTVYEAFSQIKNDSKKWAAVTNENITHMGIGVFFDPESEYGWYWCQIFTNDLVGEIEHEGQYIPERIELNNKITILVTDTDGNAVENADIEISEFSNGADTLQNIKIGKSDGISTEKTFTSSSDKRTMVVKSEIEPVTFFDLETGNTYTIRANKQNYVYISGAAGFHFNSGGNIIDDFFNEKYDGNFIIKIRPLKLTVSVKYLTNIIEGVSVEIHAPENILFDDIIGNVNFTVSDDKKILTYTTGTENAVFTGFSAGEYKIYFSEIPDGYYVKDSDLSRKITGTNDTNWNINIYSRSFSLLTYGINENSEQTAVSGAKMELSYLSDGGFYSTTSCNSPDFEITGNKITFLSNKNTYFSMLPAGDYELTELTPPNGYALTQTVTFSIDEQGNINNLTNALLSGSSSIKIIHSKYVLNLWTLPIENYITIYDMHTKQNDFDNNGLAVLTPISCTITEVYNAEWSITVEYPVDIEQKWKYITEFNIIKVLGQLFVIKKVEHSWTGNSGKVTAYAEHVFYQMNDAWLKKGTEIVGINGKTIIWNALIQADISGFSETESTIYSYDYNSDLTTENTGVHMGTLCRSKWNPIQSGMTPSEFLLGSDGFTENFGGELYRDNFYFSINKEMENSVSDSFDIRVGLNLTGIKRTIDTTSLCTSYTAFDKFGTGISFFWTGSYTIPHHVVRSQVYEFGENYTESDMGLLTHEAGKYFDKYSEPQATYTVSIEDVKNNPDYREFANNPRYKVGDSGRIFDERLGISVNVRIIKTIKDGLTGKILEVTFSAVKGYSRGDYDIEIKESTPPVPEEPEKPEENGDEL